MPVIMPVRIIPSVVPAPAPRRRIPGIVPTTVPGIVSPAEIKSPIAWPDRHPDVDRGTVGDVYGRGIPNHRPDVFRIVAHDKGGIQFEV